MNLTSGRVYFDGRNGLTVMGKDWLSIAFLEVVLPPAGAVPGLLLDLDRPLFKIQLSTLHTNNKF